MSQKCAMVKRPYPPGMKSKKRGRGRPSEYAKQLAGKQKLRRCYGLRERQFKKYVEFALANRRTDQVLFLLRRLEKRMDNIVFRLGFAASRQQARQLISHGHFLLNNKRANIPSIEAKKNDQINIKASALNKGVFKNLPGLIKKQQTPSWLELDKEKLQGIIKSEPTIEEAAAPTEISDILEFYSR